MNKRYIIIIIIASLILTPNWLVSKRPMKLAASESSYSIPRHIQYSFTLQNRTNRLIKDAQFWTYAPVRQTATQQCVRIETSHPYTLISDDQGNQILHFSFHTIAPYATKIITIEADLLLSDRPNPISEKDLGIYLGAEKYCESDNPEISQLAQRLKAKTPFKTVQKIFHWVSGNLHYTGYVKNVRGAYYALKSKKGDCTEFMYLFAALCRADEIPARCLGGYICGENTILKPSGYHNWAEFYDNGIWQIADPQRKLLMQNQSHYISMQVIGESPQNPMGNYHQFRCIGDGLLVKMNG